MINVLILEDEELSAKRLIRLLNALNYDINILNQFDTVLESISYLQYNKNNIDLIFLDIHLADGNSFEIFRQIQLKIPIIFVTAYDNYTLKAFKQTSVDYLLKPIQYDQLKKSLLKFEDVFYKRKNNFQINYNDLIKELKSDGYKKRFLVQVGDKIRSIDTDEIALFYAENKFCFLKTINNNIYNISYTLKSLENLLNPNDFFRVNRKVIVKFNIIKELYVFSQSKYKVKINNPLDFEVFVSSERLSDLKKWMNK